MPDQTPFPPGEQPDEPWLVVPLGAEPADDHSALAALFAAALAPPTEAELADEGAVRAAFAGRGPGGGLADPAPIGGRPARGARLSSKVAAAVAVGSLSLAGVGAAALGGVLPGQGGGGEGQGRATVGSDPTGGVSTRSTGSASPGPLDGGGTSSAAPSDRGPAGPRASGPAALGRCAAFLKGGLPENSVAFRRLVRAAGGRENLETYCAAAPQPGNGSGAAPSTGPGGSPASPTRPPKPVRPGKPAKPGKPPKPGQSKSGQSKSGQSKSGQAKPATPTTRAARQARPPGRGGIHSDV